MSAACFYQKKAFFLPYFYNCSIFVLTSKHDIMAKIITNLKELSELFIDCCNKYEYISFVTAWAGKSNAVIDALYENRSKIVHSSIGLQFYQTAPEFIDRFWNVEEIQYCKNNSTDVFHPKAYLFFNEDGSKWSVLIGSSNLTNGGFARNKECNVLLTSETDDNHIFNSVKDMIEDCWLYSSILSPKEFEVYEENASIQKPYLKQLRKPVCPEINNLDWDGYMKRMADNQDEGTIESASNKTRLSLLDTAQRLFKEYKSLKFFPEEYAEAIVGLKRDFKGIDDWCFFGSMTANGVFKSNFKKKYLTGLSEALDIIPQDGQVKESQFNRFVQAVRKVTKYKDPITLCTRMLAMKRPDIFVCAAGRSSKNGNDSTMSKLCSLLKLDRKTLSIDNYWSLIILNIQKSDWYQTDVDSIAEEEKKIYTYRAAMLDALYY